MKHALIRCASMPQHVFLDRDGVINRKLSSGYVTSWREFEFLPGVLEALHLLKENGYKSLVVSNQAAVGKKLMTMAQLSDITSRLLSHVQKNGGHIHGVYYCPHTADDDCNCRKPRPGLLLKAQKEHHLFFDRTFLIGDSEADGLAAQSAGCPFIRVLSGEREVTNPSSPMTQTTFRSLLQAVNFLLASRVGGDRRRVYSAM